MRSSEFAELKAFATIAEQGSFVRAAAILAISPSTLSQTLRRLEERLAIRLINRTTRSLSLTEAGQKMMQHLQPALSGLELAVSDAQNCGQSPAGLLRLNVAKVAALSILSPLLAGFLRSYPLIKVEIVTEDGLSDIVATQCDAGIRLGENLHQNMTAICLSQTFKLKVVASPDYLKQHGWPKQPQDLQHHQCLNYKRPSDGSVYRWEFIRNGKIFDVAVEGQLLVDEPAILTRVVRDGAGIACLLDEEVDSWIASGELVQLLTDWTPVFPGFYLYYSGGAPLSAPLRAFVDYLKLHRQRSGSEER